MFETMRAFVAVNLDIATTRRIAALQRDVRSAAAAHHPRTSWPAPTSFSIGLRFLGNIDVGLAQPLADELRAAVTAMPPLRVQVSGLVPFPSVEHARLLVVDVVESAGQLVWLAERVDQMALSLGLPAVSHVIRPHITLGRIPEAVDTQLWANSFKQPIGDGRVTECVLYRIQSKRPAHEYKAEERFPIAGASLSRSIRPSKAPRQPSQRPPRTRSKAPGPAPAPTQEVVAIPAPPKLPTLQPPPADLAPASTPPASAPPASAQRHSILPPAVEASLPREEDWD